ncbi:MAG: AmmeMemoRadiSam system radical SAM enzyme [Brevinematales bacterium]|jgi:pyruvate formate lyase activating enzyme
MKIACCFKKEKEPAVRCMLCPHNCLIADGKSGICGARKNEGGMLYSMNYGVISGLSFDPIEKKPLYHYYPANEVLSIGTVGCNLHCPFCQNYHISRYFDDRGEDVFNISSPGDIVSVLENRSGVFSRPVFGGAAYTYSEPLVWIEFVRETAGLMKEKGYKNILVTNGYINKEPLSGLLPLIDAANIDLKAFTESNYRKLGGSLKPVLDSIEQFIKAGVHIELTTLVVTGLNDNLEELGGLIKWISGADRSIPYHLSRYFPQYLYKEKATDTEIINEAKKMADSYLDYVYTGNMDAYADSNSYCPSCRNVLVVRKGYNASVSGIKEGKCSSCGRKADFIL